MPLLSKSLGTYVRETRVGIGLLLVMGLVRFLMLPVFGVPYDDGTTYTSMTILLLLLALYYFYAASQRVRTRYGDMLGIAFALSVATNVIIAVGIAIDDFGGIDTYFTDPAHGGDLDPLVHLGGHLVGSPVGALVLWGPGSLILKLMGRKSPDGGS